MDVTHLANTITNAQLVWIVAVSNNFNVNSVLVADMPRKSALNMISVALDQALFAEMASKSSPKILFTWLYGPQSICMN